MRHILFPLSSFCFSLSILLSSSFSRTHAEREKEPFSPYIGKHTALKSNPHKAFFAVTGIVIASGVAYVIYRNAKESTNNPSALPPDNNEFNQEGPQQIIPKTEVENNPGDDNTGPLSNEDNTTNENNLDQNNTEQNQQNNEQVIPEKQEETEVENNPDDDNTGPLSNEDNTTNENNFEQNNTEQNQDKPLNNIDANELNKLFDSYQNGDYSQEAIDLIARLDQQSADESASNNLPASTEVKKKEEEGIYEKQRKAFWDENNGRITLASTSQYSANEGKAACAYFAAGMIRESIDNPDADLHSPAILNRVLQEAMEKKKQQDILNHRNNAESAHHDEAIAQYQLEYDFSTPPEALNNETDVKEFINKSYNASKNRYGLIQSAMETWALILSKDGKMVDLVDSHTRTHLNTGDITMDNAFLKPLTIDNFSKYLISFGEGNRKEANSLYKNAPNHSLHYAQLQTMIYWVKEKE